MDYIDLIMREPKPEMIKQGDGYQFIPKSTLQKELLLIYKGHTKWNMKDETVTTNGMWGKGKLQVKHPESGEWLSYSGSAALSNGNGMRLNYPSLDAQCFKNACKKIGPWFGQLLNLEFEDSEPKDFTLSKKEADVEKQCNEDFHKAKALIKKSTNEAQAWAIAEKFGLKMHHEIKTIIHEKYAMNK